MSKLLDLVKEFASDFTPPQTAMDGKSYGTVLRRARYVRFLDRSTGLDRNRRRSVCTRILHLELRSWSTYAWASKPSGFSESARTTLCGTQSKSSSSRVSTLPTSAMGLNDIRRIIENLVAKRDSRRDGFVELHAQSDDRTTWAAMPTK